MEKICHKKIVILKIQWIKTFGNKDYRMIFKQKKNGLEDKGNVTFFTTIKYIHIKNK